ncbi:MinD/ParA family protein [Microbacterium sp. NC79]|nr:MinD/ParA family protein [Microbacterium sp. NC79]
MSVESDVDAEDAELEDDDAAETVIAEPAHDADDEAAAEAARVAEEEAEAARVAEEAAAAEAARLAAEEAAAEEAAAEAARVAEEEAAAEAARVAEEEAAAAEAERLTAEEAAAEAARVAEEEAAAEAARVAEEEAEAARVAEEAAAAEAARVAEEEAAEAARVAEEEVEAARVAEAARLAEEAAEAARLAEEEVAAEAARVAEEEAAAEAALVAEEEAEAARVAEEEAAAEAARVAEEEAEAARLAEEAEAARLVEEAERAQEAAATQEAPVLEEEADAAATLPESAADGDSADADNDESDDHETDNERADSARDASDVTDEIFAEDADVDDAPAADMNDMEEETPVTGAADPTAKRDPRDLERVKTRQEIPMTSKRLDDLSSASRETSDLLTADRLLDRSQLAKPEPEGAWRHLVYSMTGKRINLGDSKRARARKALTAQIAAPLAGGSRFVPVLSRKGGVGKTTVTALLGMALADARDDRVIAVDANPDRGTLAERIARPTSKTVRDLVRARNDIRGYNDLSDIVARDETRLDVLASDSDPRVSEAFSDDDYRAVADVTARYYSLVLTDTGTGIVHSVMGATLDLADQLIIVAGLSVDEAKLASETLTWLETNGYAQQAQNAIVVLNQASVGTPLIHRNELESHFRTRVREVVSIPYDPMIATGSAISFRDLQPETREAARTLAAKVIDALRKPAS